MKILAFDSTAVSASVALVDDDKIIGEFFTNAGLTHSKTLVAMAEDLLKITQRSISDIDALAVCCGPGSFTGVRIGVSAVKGISSVIDKPCIPVSTLEAIAQNLIACEGIICCVMDARCSQVYNAVFKAHCGGLTRLCADRALSIEELEKELAEYKQPIFLAGDGAELCMRELEGRINRLSLAPPAYRYQRASSAAFAALKTDSSKYCTAEQLMPVYLRLPQAQRELMKTKRNNASPFVE